MMRYFSLIVVFGVMVSMMGLAGCSVNPVTGERQLVLISEKEEIAMGLQAAAEFEKQFDGLVSDASLQGYIKRVGAKVAAGSDRKIPYEFGLLNSEIPNAFALPGGKVYITVGLMRKMGNERQLASVLGHEIGHIAAMHSVQQLQRQMGGALLVEIAQAAAGEEYAGAAKVATQVSFNMVNMKYSRDQEYQADMLGIRYMARAGYNPWGAVELLTVLNNLSKHKSSGLEEMFATHPLTPKRIAEAEEIVRKEHGRFSADERDVNEGVFLGMRGKIRVKK